MDALTRRKLWHVASAFHEAGHAVMAARHGILGDFVTLDPTEDHSGDDAGTTKLKKPPPNPEELRQVLRGYVLTAAAAAGVVAQCIAIDRGLVGYTSPNARAKALFQASVTDHHDRQAVAGYLRYLGDPSDEAAVNRLYDSAAAEAEAILSRPAVWAATESVAKALVDRKALSGEDVIAIARDCDALV